MKKLVLLCITLMALGMLSCSDDEVDEIIDTIKPIKLEVNQTEIEPFGRILVKLGLEAEEVWNDYDSIHWYMNGFAYHSWFNPFDDEESLDRSVTDYRLGENVIEVHGYKEGKLLSKDFVTYNVNKPTKDFFQITWGDKSGASNYYYTSVSVQYEEDRWSSILLDLYHYTKPELKEYAILSMMPHSSNMGRIVDLDKLQSASKTRGELRKNLPDIDSYDFAGKIRSDIEEEFEEARQMTFLFWHEYITMMFGSSILRYEGEDITQTTLWDEYNKRFANKLPDAALIYTNVYPIEIWETKTSYICIYAVNRGWYYVIAEPRTK